jgi:hypothetical protein
MCASWKGEREGSTHMIFMLPVRERTDFNATYFEWYKKRTSAQTFSVFSYSAIPNCMQTLCCCCCTHFEPSIAALIDSSLELFHRWHEISHSLHCARTKRESEPLEIDLVRSHSKIIWFSQLGPKQCAHTQFLFLGNDCDGKNVKELESDPCDNGKL